MKGGFSRHLRSRLTLPTPVARQREVVCLRPNGHQVVLGTAGCGKTTMAILRAAFLSDPEMPRHGRTLLITYNKALSAYIRTIAAPELRNVTVEHYHKFARGYLASRGKMRWNSIARTGPREKAIEAAIAEVKLNYKPDLPFGAKAFLIRTQNLRVF